MTRKEVLVARETKTERERRQVAGFLRDFIAYDKLESVEPDPPDVRVLRNGSPILNLEVTEYHDDPEEVASNKRWTERLWPKVDELRRKDPSAKNILGFIVFSNSKLPTLNRADDEQLADELVRLAKQVGSTLGNSEHLKNLFLGPCGPCFLPHYPNASTALEFLPERGMASLLAACRGGYL